MKASSPMRFLILGILVILVPPALADYHYVSHEGSDEWPYTSWETAADSIIKAIYAAEPYDTIFIGPGDYYEVVHMPREDTCLTFIGAGTDSTRVWSDEPLNLWIARNNCAFSHIWFEHRINRACLSSWFGASITVTNCLFTGYIGILGNGDSAIVEDCEFYGMNGAIRPLYPEKFIYRNNIFRTPSVWGGGAIILGDWHSGVITNNIFILEDDSELRFVESTDYTDSLVFRNNYLFNLAEGHHIHSPYEADVSNNTISKIYRGNVWFDRGLEFVAGYRESLEISITNNAITECGYGVEINFPDNPNWHSSVSYNAFWRNVHADIYSNFVNIDTVGNFNAFPMFVSDDDPHLQAFSPLIDAGHPDILDVDGTRSDIGVYGGPGGTSYEYQDLPPLVPDSLSGLVFGDTILLNWRMNYEADFSHYLVHRDTLSGFQPDQFNLVAEPETSYFADHDWLPGRDYYYRLAALDNQGNLSDYSEELAVVTTGFEDRFGVEIPTITAIQSNYPNPFNFQTTIVYSVANLGPIPAQINIDIYDVLGRKVRTLVDERQEVGVHRVTWDGKDDLGNDLPTGIYFARITQWHVDYLGRTQKLMLLR